MNIANIFGLHLNCRVKVYNVIADLLAVNKQGVVEIFTNGDDSSSLARVEDCKLILKPLSKITDEDKAELAKFIENSYHKKGEVVISNVYWCPDLQGLKYTRNGSKMQIYDDSPEIMFKLATMGYDIGLVPDEYKEVEE